MAKDFLLALPFLSYLMRVLLSDTACNHHDQSNQGWVAMEKKAQEGEEDEEEEEEEEEDGKGTTRKDIGTN